MDVVRLSAAVLLALPLAAGCSSWMGADVCERAMESAAEPVTDSEVSESRPRRANLVLDATSTLTEPVRLTVRVADRVAVDVELPGTPSSCSHQPVHRYHFDLPPGVTRVAAVTGEGQRETTTVRVGEARRWVVVQVQDGFPLHLEVWDERPQWG